MAIGSVVLTSVFLGMTLQLMVLRYLVAALLVGMGIDRLLRHRHPRWVRMQVGFRDLTVWLFLMASAHGAGLMVVPVLLRTNTVEAQSRIAGHNHISQTVTPLAGMLATGVHTVAYLAVTGLLAWVVYEVRPRTFAQGVGQLRSGMGSRAVATGLVTLLT